VHPGAFLTVSKLELCAPWDKDRRSIVPLIQIAVVDLCRPECMPVVCGHLRSLVQCQGIRVNRGLGNATHNCFYDVMDSQTHTPRPPWMQCSKILAFIPRALWIRSAWWQ